PTIYRLTIDINTGDPHIYKYPYKGRLPRGSVLKTVGRVLCFSGKRTLLVRCDAAQLPRLYSDVIDRRMRPLGKLVDVFGNISSPIAAVRCHGRCTIAAGEKVFAK